ncbi:MAG TPA: Rieske (2Fe-2S) protein [Thermomicrobiales bacterium]|nr:Rieske (2Fe-2S) protein [Thermomicrobiales bacterium]
MGKHAVAEVGEIPPGGRKIVEVDGRSIGIFNVDGEFFALRNSCPHQGGPLCQGSVSGFVSSAGPGDYHYSRRGEILRCPWHGWEFEIRTGQSWFDPRKVRVRRYEVRVEPASVASAGDPVPTVEMEKGPYVAETFPVTVERRYVVVEVPG